MTLIERTMYLITAEYTFFSSEHGTFAKVDPKKRPYILGYKTSLNKFQRIKVIWSILSDHNNIKC